MAIADVIHEKSAYIYYKNKFKMFFRLAQIIIYFNIATLVSMLIKVFYPIA